MVDRKQNRVGLKSLGYNFLCLAICLIFTSSAMAHSSSPFLIELLVGQSATWTIVPDGPDERLANTEYDAPTFTTVGFPPVISSTTDIVSITPNSAVSKQDSTYTIKGEKAGVLNVSVSWCYDNPDPEIPPFCSQNIVTVIVKEVFNGFPHSFFTNTLYEFEQDLQAGLLLCIAEELEGEPFGVDIELGFTDKRFGTNFIIDPTTILPNSFGSVDAIGTLNGSQNQLLSRIEARAADVDGQTLVTIDPDFSPLGTSSVTLEYFNGKDRVFRKSGVGVDDNPWFRPQGNMFTSCGPSPENGNMDVALRFRDGPINIRNAVNGDYLADRIVYRADDQSNTIGGVDSLELRALNAPFFKLNQERLRNVNRQFGIKHKSLGGATLAPNGGLHVNNIGDSGEDGFGINVGCMQGLFLIDILMNPALLFAGDIINVNTLGSVNGQTRQLISSINAEMVDNGTNQFARVIPDFSPVGADTYRMDIWNGDTLISTQENVSGPCLRLIPPAYACYICGCEPADEGGLLASIAVRDGEAPLRVATQGTEFIDATRVDFRPENPTATVDFVSHFNTTLRGLPNLAIQNEEFSYFNTDLFFKLALTAKGLLSLDKGFYRLEDFNTDNYDVGLGYRYVGDDAFQTQVNYELDDLELRHDDSGFGVDIRGGVPGDSDWLLGRLRCEYRLDTHNTVIGGLFFGNTGNQVDVEAVKDDGSIGKVTVQGDSSGDFVAGTIVGNELPTIRSVTRLVPQITTGGGIAIEFKDEIALDTGNGVLQGSELRITPQVQPENVNTISQIDLTGKNIDEIKVTSKNTSIIPKPASIISATPLKGNQGQKIVIFGENFGNSVDDLCVIIMDGNRSIPIHVEEVTPNIIKGRLGAVPPDAQPGPIMVGKGKGVRTSDINFSLSGTTLLDDVWVWKKDPPESEDAAGPIFTAFPIGIDPNNPDPNFPDPNNVPPPPDDPNVCKLFSGGPTNGQLCLTVDCDWPEDSQVSISGRIRDNARNKGLDLFAACTVFDGGPYTAFECAQRICDLLQSAWLQQAGFGINCAVNDNGDGTAKITVTFPPPCTIDWGNLTVCIKSTGQGDGGEDPNDPPLPTEEPNEILPSKISIKADKDRQSPSDGFSFTGTFDADESDFVGTQLVALDLVGTDPIFGTSVTVDSNNLKKGKFRSKGDVSLSFDFNKGTVGVNAKNVDLSGLQTPFNIEIGFGDYSGTAIIDDSFFKKPLPICLMTGVEDSLDITKQKFKSSKKGFSLSLSGGIAAADQDLDLTLDDITFEYGDNFIETLPAGSFTSKKPGVFGFKQPKGGSGDINGCTVDLNKCTFKFDIKDSQIPLENSGDVDFLIFSDGFESGDTAAWN